MSISTNHNVEMFPDMVVGLRECVCECGCGQVFYQKAIGRVKKYVDSKHKAAAYRAKKQAKQTQAPIGDIVKEICEYLDRVAEFEPDNNHVGLSATTIAWLYDTVQANGLVNMCVALNEIQEVWQK